MIQNALNIRLKPAIENTSSTKVPLDGEIVFVKDTSNTANNNIRIGNGADDIASLSNFLTLSSGGGATYQTTLNGTAYGASGGTSLGSWYAPTNAGLSGQFLISNGSGAPSWGSFVSGGVSEGNLTTSSLKYYSTVKGGVDSDGVSYLKTLSRFSGESSDRTVYFRGDSAAPLKMYDGTGNRVLNKIITSNGTIVAPTSSDNGKYLKATVSGGSTSFSWDTPSGGGSYTLPTAQANVLGGLIVSSDTDADTGYRNLDSAVAVPVFYGIVSNMYTRDKETQDYDMENPSEETTHYVNVRDVFNGIIHDQEMAIQLKAFLEWLMQHNPEQDWPWWGPKK